MNEKILDRLYKYSLNCLRINNLNTAVFWANKLNSLEPNNVEYLIFYAFLLLTDKQYHRAIRIIEDSGIKNLHSFYLTAKAYSETKQLEIALEILEGIKDYTISFGTLINDFLPDDNFPACIYYLKGKIHEANGNLTMAISNYKQTLDVDPMNYDAFMSLSQFTNLSNDIEKFKFNPEDNLHQLTKHLYNSNYGLVDFNELPKEFEKMQNNLDVLTSKAKNFFYFCQFHNCYQLTKKILDKNPFEPNCLPIHISVLKVLEKQNELFILSDELVNSYPDKAVSWYASGCYYFSIGSSDLAKAHFKKSLQLNRHFAYSWIALGHVSSSDGERDQAISAYCEAANTIVDSHMAVLYMGMEYSLTETTRVAIQCFKEAEALSKTKNPFIFGEIGVCFYKSGNYEYSCLYIKDAIKILESDYIVDSSGLPAKFWESFYNNLGHALRRSKMYPDSLKCHRKALKMVGDSVVALEGLAITLMMMNKLTDALACFSRAVDLRKPISMNSPTSLGIMLIVRIMNKLETIERGITTNITSDKECKKTELTQEFLEDLEYLES